MITVRSDKAASVRLGATPVESRPDGYRVYRGVATYGDVVLRYPDLDPPRSEFVPADEALSDEAVASLIGVPFTIEHPASLLDGATAREHTVGVVLRAIADRTASPPALKVDVIVHDAAAQEDIESGRMCELSPGYRCEEEPADGEHGGQAYQVVQRRRRYNHLSGVSKARTVTPDGRPARLDEQAPEGPAYPPATRAAEAHQPVTRTPAMDETTTNPDAPATETAGKPRTDADAMLYDALSPEDAEILKSMSAEAQAAIMAAMGAGGPASSEGSGPAGEAAPIEAAGAEMEMETTTMDKLLAAIETLTADVAALKAGSGSTDAAPAAAPGKPADKKDGLPNMSAVAVDADAIIAEARKAAVTAARETFDSSGKFVAAVRTDGHHDVATVADAAKVMLVTIGKHLPLLKPDAEADLKAGRMDALTTKYRQAEAIRRDGLLESQGRAVMDALGASGNDLQSGGDLVGSAANTIAPFRLPSPRGA